MDLLIREAQPDDAEAIVAIFNPIIKAGLYTTFDTPFTVEAEREFILNLPERGILHVAVRRQDQKIVGFQGMTALPAYNRAFEHVGVLGTFVDLAHRRQGIAKRLFETTFRVAKRKGYEKIFTYVRADNVAALATYLSRGFHIVGTAQRHARINGKYVDEIIIEKLL